MRHLNLLLAVFTISLCSIPALAQAAPEYNWASSVELTVNPIAGTQGYNGADVVQICGATGKTTTILSQNVSLISDPFIPITLTIAVQFWRGGPDSGGAPSIFHAMPIDLASSTPASSTISVFNSNPAVGANRFLLYGYFVNIPSSGPGGANNAPPATMPTGNISYNSSMVLHGPNDCAIIQTWRQYLTPASAEPYALVSIRMTEL